MNTTRPGRSATIGNIWSYGLSTLLVCMLCGYAQSADWPQWGRDATKNMASPDAVNLPSDFAPGDGDGQAAKHIKWSVKLGSTAYGNPTVSGGRIFIGTNNVVPRNPKLKGDRSNLYCLDEATGKFLWQFSVPKLGAGKVGDWEYLGICSSPNVDGERVYVITNRCEVVCLDVAGMSNGNDGPFQDEGQYMAGPRKPALEVGATDADIIWVFDMAGELGVFPHNVTSSSILVMGDRVYATTSNGVDYSHKHIINPRAPTLIVLDKRTGQLVGEEASDISKRIMHCNWSSPAAGQVDGQPMLIFGAGDGFCYGFDPQPKPDEDGYDVLEELWRFDCNTPARRFKRGKPARYPTFAGPSEVIATPVFYKDRVYVAVGQDPEHGDGLGGLSCIDVTKRGDISKSGLIWRYDDVARSISTVSILDDLLYIADYSGVIHCLDALTGKVYWTHDTDSHIWGSTLAADGKVFIGNEEGVMTIMAAGKEKRILNEIQFDGPIHASPIVANGTLYIATTTHLYAIAAE
jgi:outer membrane protein assembly factor BamB